MQAPCSLHLCRVMHARRFPLSYRFYYRIFTILLDIDRQAEASQMSRLFSCDRKSPVSFYQRDHGPCDGSSLRNWIDAILAERGLPAPHQVLLQCMPRVLGYVFNPISLWYCFNCAGQPIAVLVEVNNTFGEKHCYLLEQQGQHLCWPVRKRCQKNFHVSPFIGMQASYAFRIADPRQQLSIGIREYQNDQLMLVANQYGERVALGDRQLWRCLITLPVSTLKVIVAIHWQALKISVRGGRFHSKPEPPRRLVS